MSDPDVERLAERVRAVERAVTGSERPPADVADAAETTDRIASVEDRVDGVEKRLAELEAATEALRGYVGNVNSVNEDVERRAEAALSMATSLRSGDEATGERSPPEGGTDPGEDSPGRARENRGEATGAHGRWDEASGPWEPAGAATPSGDTAGTDPDDPSRETDAPTPGPDGRDRKGSGARGGSDAMTGSRASDWDPTAWPDDDPAPVGTGDEWPPDGMDVDRAQPWAVPDPGEEEWDHEDDRTLLDRVREAL